MKSKLPAPTAGRIIYMVDQKIKVMSVKLTNNQVIMVGQLLAAKWELSQAQAENYSPAIKFWEVAVYKKKEQLLKEVGFDTFQEILRKKKLLD